MTSLALTLLLVVAAPPATPDPAPITLDFTQHDGTPRLVFVGDTGEPGPIVERWRKTVIAEPKDAVVVLGDLVYDQVPPCPNGVPDAAARQVLESHLAHALEGLGAPSLLVLGNHDRSWVDNEAPRERCVIAFAWPRADLRLPARYYAADFGTFVLVVLDTNRLDDAQAAFAKQVAAEHPKARLVMAGHHVMRTYHDKDGEDRVHPWLAAHDLHPALWLNGHAHVLQFGVYHGVPSVTSGTGAAPREKPVCDDAHKDGCGEGQRYGSSIPGFAVLDVGNDGRFAVTYQDADGKPLYRWAEGQP